MGGKRVLRTKYKKKRDRIDEVVENVIIFIELARGTHRFLHKQKKLTPQLDIRIVTEVNFAFNLLINAFKITKGYIAQISAEIKASPEYADEVKAMADSLVPGSAKNVQLFGVGDLPKTLTDKNKEKIRDKEIQSGKGLIIKP